MGIIGQYVELHSELLSDTFHRQFGKAFLTEDESLPSPTAL